MRDPRAAVTTGSVPNGVSKKPLLVTAFLLWALVLAPVDPALAHSGYHYAGAQTTTRYDGVYGWIEVTNAGTRANTADFFANRVMAKNSAGTVWIEVGWAETGWHLVDGLPRQFVYVYDTAHSDWHFYNLVAPGGHIDVRIIKATTCSIGDPSCTFHAQLFNHSTGLWQTLHSVILPIDRGYLEEYSEVYEDPNQPAQHMSIDIPNNSLNWFETQRRVADGSWGLWTGNTSAGDSSTSYCTTWQHQHYQFIVVRSC